MKYLYVPKEIMLKLQQLLDLIKPLESEQFMHYGLSPVGPVPPRNTASPVG
jgi:hypothetical protein